MLVGAGASRSYSQTAASGSSRVPTLKRLETAYLKQAHEDVAALAAKRQAVSLKTGFQDLRCIIHAHSYLSHDSRGTIAEIAAAAKSAGVAAVLLTNHPKTDVDVVTAGQTDAVDGVMFFAGSETNGFLVFPGDGKLPLLNVGEQELVKSIGNSHGLIFIAHPEEHKDWSLTGLTGTEIYNTHADFKDESELVAALRPSDAAGYGKLLSVLGGFKAYPQECFAALFDPPAENLARFDELAKDGSPAAIAGNDSHQNTGFVLKGESDSKIAVEDPLGERLGTLDAVKNPILKTLFGEPVPGKELMRRILDPYPVSFHYVSTHVLVKEQSRDEILRSLKAGRTYVAFDWIADPTGFAFLITTGSLTGTMGSSVKEEGDRAKRQDH